MPETCLVWDLHTHPFCVDDVRTEKNGDRANRENPRSSAWSVSDSAQECKSAPRAKTQVSGGVWVPNHKQVTDDQPPANRVRREVA
jgi:hypothetical protein